MRITGESFAQLLLRLFFQKTFRIQRREYRSVMQPEMFWMKKVSLLVMRSLLMIRENRIQIGWKFCRRYLRRKISTIPLKRMLTIICMVKSPKKKLWMQS